MRVTHLPLITILLGLATVPIHFSPTLTAALELDRDAVLSGETFRLLTCHWTHCSPDHLLWDLVTFVVLGALCEHASRARLLGCLLGSVVAIPLAVLIFLPDMEVYRGLSGLDSALFALFAITLIRQKISSREWPWVGAIAAVLLAFLGKTLYEVSTGATLFVDSQAASMVPVPLAHVVGAFVGCIAALRVRSKIT